MNHHQRMAIFDADPDRLRAAAIVALARLGAVIVAADDDPAPHPRIEAITEPGVLSIGERITLRFGDHGGVLIESRSRQWLTLFDWFVNRRNVNRIELRMREHLQSASASAKPPRKHSPLNTDKHGDP